MLTPCVICGNSGFIPLFKKAEYSIVRCPECSLVWVNPQPESSELEAYYNTSYLPPLPEKPGRILTKWQKRLQLLTGFAPGGKLLDIGCSWGHFLFPAKQQGWETLGLELSQKAACYAGENFALEVKNTDLLKADLPTQSFDLITAWHSLEHLPKPESFLKEVHRILKGQGVFALTTPNFQSLEAKLSGKNWAWLVPPAHLFYFTPQTLKRLLTKNGFKIIFLAAQKGDSEGLFYNLILARIYPPLAWLLRLFSGAKRDKIKDSPESSLSFKTRILQAACLGTEWLFTPLSLWLYPLLNKLNRGAELLVVAEKIKP